MFDSVPQYLVVLTACIDPAAGPKQVARSDPQVRLGDYLAALRWWLRLDDSRISRILFIENSGYSLKALNEIVEKENIHHKDVEFISMVANDYPADLDYGYAELNMLDLGLAQSRLAQQTSHWIKVTGRLVFPQISRLLDRLPEQYQFAVDCRTALPLFKKEKQLWVHTRLMIFSSDFYRQVLFNAKNRLRPGECIELMLFPLFASCGGGQCIRRFPVEVSPVGVSGTSGQSYNTTKRQIVNRLRAMGRIVVPRWWI